MARATPPATRDRALALLAEGRTKTEVAALTGLTRQTVINLAKRSAAPSAPGTAPPSPAPTAAPTAAPTEPPTPGVVSRAEEGDRASIDLVSDRLIRTEADALAFAEVDPAEWRVTKMEVTAWQVAMKLSAGKGEADAPVTRQLWRVHLKLARVQPKPFADALDALYERFARHKPELPRPPKRKARRPCLVEIDLYDAHFGKLAWSRETGEGYDLKITDRLYRNAVDDLLDQLVGREIERFVLTIGQDFFHVDGPRNETTNGTRQDADGRYAKIVETGEAAMVWAFERLLSAAPVTGKYVPGNHDRIASLHLARTLAAWFRTSRDVEIDTAPTLRKYLRYGCNLIGYVHGDEQKADKLPGIMATERRADWGETTSHQWRCGHLHQRSLQMTTAMDTHQGCEVWRLSSLSAADAWHYARGYVGTRRAAECFLIDKDRGYRGHFVADART